MLFLVVCVRTLNRQGEDCNDPKNGKQTIEHDTKLDDLFFSSFSRSFFFFSFFNI